LTCHGYVDYTLFFGDICVDIFDKMAPLCSYPLVFVQADGVELGIFLWQVITVPHKISAYVI